MFSRASLLIAVLIVGFTCGQKDIEDEIRKLKLTDNGKPLPDPKTEKFKEIIKKYLYGEKLKDRVPVWKKMLELCKMVAKANKKKVSHDIEDLSGLMEKHMLMEEDDIEKMINFYKKRSMAKYMDLSKTIKEIPKRDLPTVKNAVKVKSKKWKRRIPYMYKGFVKKSVVEKGIKMWEKETCLDFRRQNRPPKEPYMQFTNDDKDKNGWCLSKMGQKDRVQEIWLSTKCQKEGMVAKMIAHALGMWNEHSRLDRDKYVKVYPNRMKKSKMKQFLRYPLEKEVFFKDPPMQYDYSSIMHYDIYAFSKKPRTRRGKTIEARNKPEYDRTLGQRNTISFYDAKAVNLRYCGNLCGGLETKSKCKNDGYKDPKNCKVCKCPDGLGGQDCTEPAKSKPDAKSCGDTSLDATTKAKTFTSPGYDKDGYNRFHECSWMIKSIDKKKKGVELKFTGKFDLRCHTPCQDYVEIRFSDKLYEPGERYCCDKRPKKVFRLKKGTTMLVLFRTYSKRGEKGFKATYKAI